MQEEPAGERDTDGADDRHLGGQHRVQHCSRQVTYLLTRLCFYSLQCL